MKMKSIVLIDDSKMDNYISEFIIKERDIVEKLNVFTSAIEALEYLVMIQTNHKNFPEAIFLDINMPDMDGFGFLDEYSKFSEDLIKDSSVFMLTSSNDVNDISRALKYPVVKRYLVKPLSKDILNELF